MKINQENQAIAEKIKADISVLDDPEYPKLKCIIVYNKGTDVPIDGLFEIDKKEINNQEINDILKERLLAFVE